MPAIYQFREYAVAGGLLSYRVSITDGYRQYGVYAASILKGHEPGGFASAASGQVRAGDQSQDRERSEIATPRSQGHCIQRVK